MAESPIGSLHDSENVDFREQDIEDLESNDLTTNELAQEIEGMRRSFIHRVDQDRKGVMSEIESHGFIKQAKRLKTRGDLKKLEAEFTEQLIAQRRLMHRAAEILGAKKETLNEGEEQKIMQKFPDMSMEQKETELTRIEKMMEEREQKLEQAQTLEAEVRAKLEKELKKAENYDERLEAIEKANESNKLFKKYRKAWETEKVAAKTKTEYFEWFLGLDQTEQKRALDKARKEDIEPRTRLYDLHDKLPGKYQDPKFKNMGKTERLKHLSRVEQQIQKDYAALVWSKDTDMSNQSKAFAIRSFEQIRGTDAKINEFDRILEKIKFIEMFPAHAKAEEELRGQLEKFPANIRSPYMEQYNRSSFEEKVKIIEQIEKHEKALAQSQKQFNKTDAEIRKHFEGAFEATIDLDERGRILDQMEDFAKNKTEYFRIRKENDKYFATSMDTYEKWYNEHVTTTEEARDAKAELIKMVAKRKHLHEAFEKLDPRVQERCQNWKELGTESKTKKLKELKRLEDNLEAIDALKETAKTLEDADMEEKALEVLRKAHKLDPKDENMIKDINRLAAKLGKDDARIEDKNSETVKNDDETLEAETGESIDNIMNDINIHYDRESIIREQRAEETFEMVADNVEALGGNFEQNSKTRAGKEYRGHSKLEREIIEDVTTEDLVVDKKGRVQKVIHADFSQQKDMEKVQNEVLSPRKRDVERGVVNVDLRDKKNSGQTLKIEQARNRLADRKGKLIDLKTQNTLAKLQSKGIRFSKEQRTAIEEAIREQAEEELKEQIDSHKIYKNAA